MQSAGILSPHMHMQVDYPDSLPAVHDVRDCLAHAALQQHLVSQLRAAINKRLLHAGVCLEPRDESRALAVTVHTPHQRPSASLRLY